MGERVAQSTTVAEQIRGDFDELTRAERQLANAILENYPVSGLGSITELAEASGVSTPTVARMAHKIGFSGFPQLQPSDVAVRAAGDDIKPHLKARPLGRARA